MVDVIIPSFNCTKTLDRTLLSLVNQTKKEFKVYVIDDASQEDIESIVRMYDTQLDIHYSKNSTNVGCGMSRQVGIDLSSSDYFIFLDSDDVLIPTAIETFYTFINKHPDIEMAMSYFYRKNIDNSYMLFANGCTWCHGKLYKRSLFEKYNIRYNPKFSMWCDDGYLNTKCFELTKVMVIPQPTYIWIDENPEAITKVWEKYHPERNELYLEAMVDAYNFVLSHKQNLCTIKSVIDGITFTIDTPKEKALYDTLMELQEKYGN